MVAGEDDGGASPRLLHHHFAERLHSQRVQARERLVEHQQLGVVQQRRGELHTLLVAVRQLLQLRLRAVAEAEAVQPAQRRLERLALRHAVQPPEVSELAADLHSRVEVALLGQVAEALPVRQRDRVTVPAHLAALRLREAEDAAYGRRLPGAVRAEEAEHAPPGHAEATAVKRDRLAVALAQVAQFERDRALPLRSRLAGARAGRLRREAMHADRPPAALYNVWRCAAIHGRRAR